MRVHPFIVAAVLALAAATAWSASLIVGHGRARERRVAPPLLPPDEPPPPPRPVAAVPRVLSRPPPVAETPAPAAVLRVRVIGPHGLLVVDPDVSAVRQGQGADEEVVALEEAPDDEGVASGTFVATELEPGRYDVTVAASGLRTAHAVGVRTEGDVVTIALARAPILRGALGVGSRRDGCQGGSVAVSGPEDEDGAAERAEASLAEDCSFLVEDLPVAGPFIVEVSRAGAAAPEARALVTLPDDADPAFVCLTPPCGEPPAAVAITVADATGRRIEDATIAWTLLGDGPFGEEGTITGTGFEVLRDRHAGETLRLVATDDDRGATATIVVGRDVTEVVLSLSPRPPAPP